MNAKLKEFKMIKAENCISIILNTHRTRPDNQKDSLNLKNLLKEAETRILQQTDKRKAKVLIEKLNNLSAKIDHSLNLESLILFVNEETSECIRLPIPVKSRVIIDDNFATRDLIRAINQHTNYYVLVLNQKSSRLIEASNERLVLECGEPFPLENFAYSLTKAEGSNALRQRNLLSEYFNQIDKEIQKFHQNNPLPILICTEESNFHEYMKVADKPAIYFPEFLNMNQTDNNSQAIVSDGWPMVQDMVLSNQKLRKTELEHAIGSDKLLSDISQIWRAVNEGRIQTLFIENDLTKPAIIELNVVCELNENTVNSDGRIDDIYDEIIDINLNYGGDVVFLPNNELKSYGGFAAIIRY